MWKWVIYKNNKKIFLGCKIKKVDYFAINNNLSRIELISTHFYIYAQEIQDILHN